MNQNEFIATSILKEIISGRELSKKKKPIFCKKGAERKVCFSIQEASDFFGMKQSSFMSYMVYRRPVKNGIYFKIDALIYLKLLLKRV